MLNSEQINSKKLINGKPAKIISGQNSVYQEIEINQIGKKYSIQLVGNNSNCNDSIYIVSNHQKVFLCD